MIAVPSFAMLASRPPEVAFRSVALPQRVDELQPIAAPMKVLRIRRCAYRRLDRVKDGSRSGYDVSCLYPDGRLSRPLGGLEASGEICATCTASHIFRADED
jgi:hypothetical protein